MGTKQVHQLWDRCDGLDVTSTETLVLFFRLKREIKDGQHDGEDIAELILSQLGELPPTDDPSESEPPLSESFQATQSGKPNPVSHE